MFKVGDKVWHEDNGLYQIVRIDYGNDLALLVDADEDIDSYWSSVFSPMQEPEGSFWAHFLEIMLDTPTIRKLKDKDENCYCEIKKLMDAGHDYDCPWYRKKYG